MLASLSWLKKYVEIPVDLPTLVSELTMAGLNVEKYETVGLQDDKIIIGRVLEVSKHPNADKLSLCRVQVGPAEIKEIICGAPNVASGQFVPVALCGTVLPDGTRIKKSKIRGVYSEGMICSERELGLGEDAAGIMVLSGHFEPGTPLRESLPSSDVILEIEVTPNRPDLLSHIGLAREIAALYNKDLRIPDDYVDDQAQGRPEVPIEVEDVQDCPRYIGRIIKGVRVGPSPSWMASSLEAMGINSINNVVDATNYVMMEIGQPLHAFDLHKLQGPKIVVRKAKTGETLAALDGETYKLASEFLVIADSRVPVALAGIIGGEETSVTQSTMDILLECACFDPALVRRTRKALNINTEASYRFERGSDREICRRASDRACKLIMEIAGGEAGRIVDVYGLKSSPVRVTLDRTAPKRLLGVDIPVNEAKELLEPLGFACGQSESGDLEVQVPSYRLDIHEDADIIEELARRYGYNRIGKGWDYRCTTFAGADEFDEFIESILDHLSARGFTEVVTTSFTDGTEGDLLGWREGDPRRNHVVLRNPLVSSDRCMRTSLIPSMLEVLKRNLDQGIKRLEICQAGKIFVADPHGGGLPEERQMLTIMITKPRTEDFWLNFKKELDLFDIKRVIEELGRFFKVDLWHDFCYDFNLGEGLFRYLKKDQVIIEGGLIGEVASKRYDIDQPVWYAEIDLAGLFKARPLIRKFKQLPEFPVSKRDLSLVAKPEVTYEQIEKSLVKSGGGLIESLKLFDVYRGDRIPGGTTAYGIRIHFRSREKTLTDEEIDGLIRKMLARLKNDLDVELRE